YARACADGAPRCRLGHNRPDVPDVSRRSRTAAHWSRAGGVSAQAWTSVRRGYTRIARHALTHVREMPTVRPGIIIAANCISVPAAWRLASARKEKRESRATSAAPTFLRARVAVGASDESAANSPKSLNR